MGRLKTIGKRSFLIGSATVLGGVAFGTFMAARPHANPLKVGLGEGEAAFNPFVKLTSDGITLIVPHADIGQGVQSSQAALIAEELDIDVEQATLSFGEPNAAYYNTAFAEEGVPFMSFDDGSVAETMRGVMGGVVKLLGIQGTGGSTSMPDQYEKLRMAGAVARETIKAAASQRTGIPVAQLKTAKGEVVLPDGATIAYTDLAADAAEISAVTKVALRDPSTWVKVGKPMMRTDTFAKSTGTQIFGIDITFEGMVHASVRINPRKGGPIQSYSATEAETMRGVRAIVPVTNGVAVIADNTWRAIQAVNAIEVDWGEAPYPAEMDGHWKEVAASFVADRLDQEWRADGDVDAALADAETITIENRAPYVAHQPLEPLNAIVLVSDDSVEVWTGHQMPRFVQQQVAGVAGVDPEKVIFHNQFSGGSFGHRLEFEHIKQATEVAMTIPGTPVKLTYSREEDFLQDFPRQIAMSRAQGVVKNGQVTALSLDIASPSVIGSQGARLGQSVPGPDMQIVAGAWNMPYDIPDLRVRGYRVPELAPVSSWRSVGASHAGFFAENTLDELIRAAGADPMEERLRLVNHAVHRAVLEAVAEMSDWGKDLGPNRGRGLALVESFGVPTAEVIDVSMTDYGIKIDNVYVVADVGKVIDPINFENQVQGGVVWALGHAINSEITYSDGMAEQTNYHAAEGMRIFQTPEIEVLGLENAAKIRGIGEPPVPPAAAALASAIYDLTGVRLREMPFNKFVDFV
ncbi:molybdopterin-dependent oxidoreductase [Yoonia sp. GPGPB17]|uniref:xanthine dehydrogenase family protein molybdopterin-binding subunit n=1 Tax=Yoonia sp. GPGPB17 TaxID=3026147 RepID=UPI0030BD646E